MLLAILIAAGLAPGALTAWQAYREHGGWHRAALTGLGVTAGLVLLVLGSLILFPPLATAAAAISAILALAAYGDGRIWTGSTWTCVMAVCLWCAGVTV
ncbi:hypothetical protein AB0I84_05950 [Streptomyces spectabilis]|uniref:hypothetical protein n=1 Tax=Streptomyces spectabilis TaxID=68270 RepID=UPI0033D52D6B